MKKSNIESSGMELQLFLIVNGFVVILLREIFSEDFPAKFNLNCRKHPPKLLSSNVSIISQSRY